MAGTSSACGEMPSPAATVAAGQHGHPALSYWREQRQAPSRDRASDLRGPAAARDRHPAGALGRRQGGPGPLSGSPRWAAGGPHSCRLRLRRSQPAAPRRIHCGRTAASRTAEGLRLDRRRSPQGPLAGRPPRAGRNSAGPPLAPRMVPGCSAGSGEDSAPRSRLCRWCQLPPSRAASCRARHRSTCPASSAGRADSRAAKGCGARLACQARLPPRRFGDLGFGRAAPRCRFYLRGCVAFRRMAAMASASSSCPAATLITRS